MSSTEFTRRLAVLVLSVALGLGLGAACGEDEAPTPPARSAASQPRAQRAPVTPAQLPVDAFGNLLGSPRHTLGFELPLVAEIMREDAEGRPSRLYVEANEARLRRFYRSRGHRLIDTLEGLKIEHSDRTLRDAGTDSAVAAATLIATRGPGPGWTLALRVPATEPLKQPALLELVATETTVAAAGEPSGDAKNRAERAPALEQPGLFQDPEGDGGDGGRATRAKSKARSGTLPSPDPARLSKLRKDALRRDLNPARSRDISERIYRHVQANPDQAFLD